MNATLPMCWTPVQGNMVNITCSDTNGTRIDILASQPDSYLLSSGNVTWTISNGTSDENAVTYPVNCYPGPSSETNEMSYECGSLFYASMLTFKTSEESNGYTLLQASYAPNSDIAKASSLFCVDNSADNKKTKMASPVYPDNCSVMMDSPDLWGAVKCEVLPGNDISNQGALNGTRRYVQVFDTLDECSFTSKIHVKAVAGNLLSLSNGCTFSFESGEYVASCNAAITDNIYTVGGDGSPWVEGDIFFQHGYFSPFNNATGIATGNCTLISKEDLATFNISEYIMDNDSPPQMNISSTDLEMAYKDLEICQHPYSKITCNVTHIHSNFEDVNENSTMSWKRIDDGQACGSVWELDSDQYKHWAECRDNMDNISYCAGVGLRLSLAKQPDGTWFVAGIGGVGVNDKDKGQYEQSFTGTCEME